MLAGCAARVFQRRARNRIGLWLQTISIRPRSVIKIVQTSYLYLIDRGYAIERFGHYSGNRKVTRFSTRPGRRIEPTRVSIVEYSEIF
jgi:hypothetical protein